MAFDVPFVIQEGQGRSTEQGQQRLVNMFPHIITPAAGEAPIKSTEGKKQILLYTTPGLKAFADSGLSNGRALYQLNNVLYAVFDQNVFSCDTAGTLTTLGSISTTTGVVKMVGGPENICIVDGTKGYSYTPDTGVFAEITDTNFPDACTNIFYMQGYFIASVPDTQLFQISAINDCTTWSSSGLAQVASKTGYSDNIVTPFVLNEQLWLIGEETTEVWYNSGAALFPFEQISGAFSEYGIAAKHSVALCKNTLIWLAKSKRGSLEVVIANQLIPTSITTKALAYQLSTYTTVSDAEAFNYQDEGHNFYVITFPTADKTWVYDIDENLWHERSSYYSAAAHRWLPRAYSFFNNKHYVIPFNDGTILELDMDTYTELGSPIYRTVQSFPLYQSENRVAITKLILDVEKNCGINGGSEQITLEVSRDGGYTFEAGTSLAASRYQDYTSRVVWRNLGTARSWVFRFTTSDPIKWIFLGIIVGSDVGTE